MLTAPAAAEPGSNPFALTVDPWWILVSIVQFLVLLFLLRRILWGPVSAALAARSERIREGLEAAAAAKREREQMTVEVERLLGEARREAAQAAERTTTAAENAAAQVRAEAKAEGDRIRERARADAEQLHAQSLAQLRGEVAELAALAAAQILRREVDPATHRALIERSLDQAGTELRKSGATSGTRN